MCASQSELEIQTWHSWKTKPMSSEYLPDLELCPTARIGFSMLGQQAIASHDNCFHSTTWHVGLRSLPCLTTNFSQRSWQHQATVTSVFHRFLVMPNQPFLFWKALRHWRQLAKWSLSATFAYCRKLTEVGRPHSIVSSSLTTCTSPDKLCTNKSTSRTPGKSGNRETHGSSNCTSFLMSPASVSTDAALESESEWAGSSAPSPSPGGWTSPAASASCTTRSIADWSGQNSPLRINRNMQSTFE